ncbi:uncharacterized protein LOC103971963 [Musa acuminata AAA Group]
MGRAKWGCHSGWSLFGLLEMGATEAIAAYRALLRATREYFPGDKLRQAEAAVVIRERFEKNRGVTAEADVKLLLDEAREAFDFMSHMIEQLKLIPSGGYVVKPTK